MSEGQNWESCKMWGTAVLQLSGKGKTANVFHSKSADSNALIKKKKISSSLTGITPTPDLERIQRKVDTYWDIFLP